MLGKLTLRSRVDGASGMTLLSTDFLRYLGALEKRFGRDKTVGGTSRTSLKRLRPGTSSNS